MKPLITAALVLGTAFAGSAQAVDVGVSVEISQPGVYGRIDIGRFPQPQVWVPQPVIITRPVVVAPPQPVYMWVPPGHRKDWRKHCGKYNACGVPVYFVRDDWYDNNVHPRGKGKNKGRGDDDRGRGPGQGHGQGQGQGKGKKDN
jgi:hypothetical protein